MHVTTSQQERLDLGFGGFSCNWGTHIAGLYETEEQRDAIIFGFLRTGAEAGDFQLAVPAERSMEEFSADYASSCSDCGTQVRDPALFRIDTPRELYFPNGYFDPFEMTDNLEAFYRESQRKGRLNIRATANMTFALETIPGREHLMAYESRLNYFIPGKPWISICLYNLRKFRGDTIMQVLRTHPYTINRGVITANPYYRDPDSWLTEHAPQFLPRSGQR